jgi:SnoaL-like domain
MDRSAVQAWLDRYVAAWRANERGPIEALFTEDAAYRFHPYGGEDDVVEGASAIADAWLESPDEPDSWDARYEPFAVDGDRAVALGYSRYRAQADKEERTYHNVFLLEFAADGRCRAFTELYMREPTA